MTWQETISFLTGCMPRPVARALMQGLARECRAKGYRRIDLNVLDWNPARGFYERLGYRWIRNWLPYRLSAEALAKLADE